MLFGRTVVRWLLILALVVSVPALAAISAAPLHGHTGVSSDACNLCQFSHLPYLFDSQAPVVGPPPEAVTPLTDFIVSSHSPVLLGLVDGRAPPLA